MKTKLILVGGFLGAGKTTMLWEAASRLIAKGRKVALITNDQASQLVDSALLLKEGLEVAEVSGSCFCCNFPGFAQAIESLRDRLAPDVIIAEPVGSCADLSATILQPMKKFHSASVEVAPFTVLADPARLSPILDGEHAGLHEDAAYIFRKQLEEADEILLTKVDAYPADFLEGLLTRMKEAFPDTRIEMASALSGEGVDGWLEEMLSRNTSGLRLLDIDYDIYAHGEAVLGWLNGTLSLSGENVDWDRYARTLLGQLDGAFKEAGAPVGHVKIIVENDKGYTVGNIAGDGKMGFRGCCPPSDDATLTLNARVETSPGNLDGMVREVLEKVGSSLQYEVIAWKYLQPGRPNPTYRFDSVV